MSLLFSIVSLTSKTGTSDFLTKGIPVDKDDLLGYTAFNEYLSSIKKDSVITAHVCSYLYGNGDINIATIEEVAYMKLRAENEPDFLSRHCMKIAESHFSFFPQLEEKLEIVKNSISL